MQSDETDADVQARLAQSPIISGIGEGLEKLVSPILHPIDTAIGVPKQNPATQLYGSFKDTVPLIKAYETARSQGKGIVDSLSAANDQAGKQEAANNSVQQAIDAYKKNPSHETAKLLTEAAGTVALLGAGGVEADIPDAAEVAPEAETAPEAESTSQPGIISKIVKDEKVAQPQAAGALRNAAQASAEDAGVTTADTPSVRNLMDKPIENLTENESTAYDTLNDAAGTDLKSLYDRQSELQDALDDPTQVANKTALQNELKTTQSQITDGESNVTEKLGDQAPDLLNKAKGMTQQRYAMEDIAKKLFNNESVVNGNVAHGAPESINVDSAIRQVENLDKPSRFAPRGTPTRLQQALGTDGAKTLKQGLYDAQKTGQSAVTVQKWAKWLGIGVPSLFGAMKLGADVAKHIISVKAEPAGTDSNDTDAPDVPPDVPASALTGSGGPSLDALSTTPKMPRMATGRDYLDNPDTQAALEGLYVKASPTFVPPAMGRTTQENEHLISLDQNGKQSSYSAAPEGSSRHLVTQIPSDSSAIIHTHPYKANPVPSGTDYKTATAEGKPNFVLSRNAIYVAMPGTDPNTTSHIKVADVSPGKHGKLNVKWNQ
jgi:hypothetical protein